MPKTALHPKAVFSYPKGGEHMAKPNLRPDHNGTQRAQFESHKKKIFATQKICGICGKHVDLSLKFPHPLSPCIDHIIPETGCNIARNPPSAKPNGVHLHCQINRNFPRSPGYFMPSNMLKKPEMPCLPLPLKQRTSVFLSR